MIIIVGTTQGVDSLKNASEQQSIEIKLNSTQGQENMELSNNVNNTHAGSISSVSTTTENTSHTQRRLLQTADKSDDQTGSSETHASDAGTTGAATVENSEPLEDDADTSFDLFRDAEELPDEYNYDYDDYVDESMWGDEDWTEQEHEKAEDYVSIDAHILSTPVSEPFVSFCLYLAVRSVNDLELFFTFFLQVIADIDKDGVHEMVIAVSYFFDRE